MDAFSLVKACRVHRPPWWRQSPTLGQGHPGPSGPSYCCAPATRPQNHRPAEKLVAQYYPGIPLIPSMSTGATDGIFLEAIGIPVYGVPGGWSDPDGNGVHGLNEKRSVRSVFVGRDFLTDLVKVYADSD